MPWVQGEVDENESGNHPSCHAEGTRTLVVCRDDAEDTRFLACGLGMTHGRQDRNDACCAQSWNIG
jgi:hypothetical protein